MTVDEGLSTILACSGCGKLNLTGDTFPVGWCALAMRLEANLPLALVQSCPDCPQSLVYALGELLKSRHTEKQTELSRLNAGALCSCGWRRPVVALTVTDGPAPPANVVPCYRCPQCGEWHIAIAISEAEAASLIAALRRVGA